MCFLFYYMQNKKTNNPAYRARCIITHSSHIAHTSRVSRAQIIKITKCYLHRSLRAYQSLPVSLCVALSSFSVFRSVDAISPVHHFAISLIRLVAHLPVVACYLYVSLSLFSVFRSVDAISPAHHFAILYNAVIQIKPKCIDEFVVHTSN